ncbi:phage repressor like transcriptional regulator, XRE family [Thalassospira sp. KO164]|nr:phage repressor like transcriptional regulator, XRE family [Thalassospira sp. KO164]SEE53815.1 SOS-response transcriptional repressor LexA (RecA-mediated autopeptidase) [Thalassospira permensis]
MPNDERTKRIKALKDATEEYRDSREEIADRLEHGEIPNPEDREFYENLLDRAPVNNIRKLRKLRGWSQGELAERVSGTTSQISRLENGNLQLTMKWLETISNALNCKPYQLISNVQETVKIPIIGWVSAGAFTNSETVAIEEMSYHDTIECAGVDPNSCFALRINGDSMNLIAPEGSTIIVDVSRKDPVDKKFYVVANNGGEATFKQFKSDPPRLEPCSTNPQHETLFPQGEILIVGRVIRVIHDL